MDPSKDKEWEIDVYGNELTQLGLECEKEHGAPTCSGV